MLKPVFTQEKVDELAKTDYFRRPESPACVAIMPLIKPHYTGVEIGVFMATSSVVFLEHCRFMYFVDPCQSYAESSDPSVYAQAEGVRRILAPYGPSRFLFLETFSADAAPKIPAVNFVFIDGNHAKQFVAQDIELYWPKILPGGFLSGHDWDQVGVSAAVKEFAAKSGMPVEQHQNCWVIKKP